MANKKVSRIGTIGYNNYGSKMIIDEYIDTNNIIVKFIKQGNLVQSNWSHFCNGLVKNPYDRTVHNIGYIGEGTYKSRENYKATVQYAVWNSMIHRCYNEKNHKNRPTYKNCTVAEEWHNFQNFAKWFDENYYEVEGERMQLDKDILIKGNKIYSPDTCLFVPQSINTLFVKCNSERGEYPIGVHLHKVNSKNPYQASCSNGNKKPRISLGLFRTPEEAFYAYKSHKEKLIKQIADDYKDRIPDRLYYAMLRYSVKIDD